MTHKKGQTPKPCWIVFAHQFHHLLARGDEPGNGAKKRETGDTGGKPRLSKVVNEEEKEDEDEEEREDWWREILHHHFEGLHLHFNFYTSCNEDRLAHTKGRRGLSSQR